MFLDADGVLLDEPPHFEALDGLKLASGAGAALSTLALYGFDLVVVGHRAGVARGIHPVTALRVLETRIRGLLAPLGIPVAAFHWCPHDPAGVIAGYAVACMCRKPRPGLLQTAGAQRGLDLADSWMVGGTLEDIEAGRRAGCRTILVGARGDGMAASPRAPNHQAADLREVAALIIHAPRHSEAREGRFQATPSPRGGEK